MKTYDVHFHTHFQPKGDKHCETVQYSIHIHHKIHNNNTTYKHCVTCSSNYSKMKQSTNTISQSNDELQVEPSQQSQTTNYYEDLLIINFNRDGRDGSFHE